jgi:hypothetical protein
MAEMGGSMGNRGRFGVDSTSVERSPIRQREVRRDICSINIVVQSQQSYIISYLLAIIQKSHYPYGPKPGVLVESLALPESPYDQ